MNVRRAAVVAAVVVIVLVAALIYIRAGNESLHNDGEPGVGLTEGVQLTEEGFPSDASRLWVYGNADEDDDIDEDDLEYLRGVIDGVNPTTVLSDANCDGTVDEDDIGYLSRIIASEEVRVFYIDNYYRVAGVDWPVYRIAIGYCSGAYAVDLTGLTDKVAIVDDTIRNYWNEMDPRYAELPSFGTTEYPNYESMMAAGVDVYVVGYCDSTADGISPESLEPAGVDVMFISTADNSGVDIPNESIDRSILMFSFLLQGDMEKTYEYLAWHDGIIGVIREATSVLSEDQKETMIMARTSPFYSPSGSYSITGRDNTNNIHAEWAGVDAVGQSSPLLPKNYQNLDEEHILTLISESQRHGKVFYVDNAHDGMRSQYDLGDCLAADAEMLSSSGVEIHYLGMAREMGNSPLYVVEMAFYVCVMYPDIAGSIGLDYQELFWDYFENFASSDYWKGLDIEDFFLDYGVA